MAGARIFCLGCRLLDVFTLGTGLMSDSITPFIREAQNNLRPIRTYTKSLQVDGIQYIGADLCDFIQVVERSVCGKIGHGQHRVMLQNSKYNRIRKRIGAVTPEKLRSRLWGIPLTEARSWIFYTVALHPEFRLSSIKTGKIYGRDGSTVRTSIRDVQFRVRECRKTLRAMRSVSDDLVAAGFEPLNLPEAR